MTLHGQLEKEAVETIISNALPVYHKHEERGEMEGRPGGLRFQRQKLGPGG
jgi:hypothetical protein